jgi:hypothetical protein
VTRVGRGLLALACSAMTMHAQANPAVVALQLPKTVRLTGLLDVDVDGDGRLDLVLACFDEQTKKRELRTHLRSARTPRFAGEPSLTSYALERDVIAFAFADVHMSPGRELVLFTADRAVAVLPAPSPRDAAAAEGPRYEPLFGHRLLWAVPDATEALALDDVVHDVDGDGHDDFLLPELDGARLVLQRRKDGAVSFAPPVLWQLPAWRSPFEAGTAGGPVSARGGQFAIGLFDDADGDFDHRPLVRLHARTPRMLLCDLAGDGVRDGLALRNESLWCWSIDPGTGIAATPKSTALPLPEDRLELFDPAFDVQLADVTRDGRADLLLTTSARRNDEVEVRIDLFVQRDAAGTWSTKPDNRLRMQTLATTPQLVDADGDGRLDLVAITVRTDLLRGLTGEGQTSLQAQLNVFRGSASGFDVPAMLNQQLQLPVRQGRQRSPFVRVLAGPDGAALLLRIEDRIALQPLQCFDTRLRLSPPSWQVPIPPAAAPRLARGAPEVLVVDEHELLHVSWR